MCTISELCKKYTELTEEDIDIIRDMSKFLTTFADLEEADILSTVLPTMETLLSSQRQSPPVFRRLIRKLWSVCWQNRKTNRPWLGRSGWESVPAR